MNIAMANTGTKSLDLETQERLRAIVKRVVDGDFSGNATLAAAALEVSQSYLSTYLNNGTGGGRKILAGLTKIRPDLAAELYGLPPVRVVERERSEPRTFEELARANGLDPEDPEVRSIVGAAFQNLESQRQLLDFTIRSLREKKAERKGKSVSTSRKVEDEEF